MFIYMSYKEIVFHDKLFSPLTVLDDDCDGALGYDADGLDR